VPSAKPHIILIDGKSGVGKTRLAIHLADALDATLVHLDDAYPGWGGLADGRDAVIETVLTPLAAGLPGRYRAWDWERGAAGALVEIAPADVVVIDGCGVSTPQSRELASTVVWVECDEAVRLARLVDRDGDQFDDFSDAWDEQVDAHIAQNNPIGTATVVVRT
jgi:uridine kinase